MTYIIWLLWVVTKKKLTLTFLFNEFFESVPSDYGKLLINTKNWDENKKAAEEIEDKISGFEGEIRMSEKEKKDKNVDETLEIIRKILDYNTKAQNLFHCASKVDKKKSKPKIEKSIAERVKLRQKVDIIATKERNINDELFSYYLDYSNPNIMFKRLRDASDKKIKIW